MGGGPRMVRGGVAGLQPATQNDGGCGGHEWCEVSFGCGVSSLEGGMASF